MAKKRKTSVQVLIVGGGFGGVRTALQLAKDPNNQITLISDKEDFQYYPTLYSSATGHSRLESWAPLGEIFADYANVEVYIDTIQDVDAKSKTVYGASGASYHYETLVMALGVVTTYFGIPGLEAFTYGIKSVDEIKKLKQRLFIDIAEKNQLDRNYVVIGAGPTGTELAAALGAYIRRLCKQYKVKSHGVKIHLIEAAPRVLPRSSEMTSRIVENRLRKLGVHVETSKKVEEANAKALIVSGRPIESHTVIWTSGVANNPLFAQLPKVFTLDPRGKVVVDKYFAASKDIYVLGDNAATPYAGLAQTAIHNADVVAKNILRQARGKKPKPYKARLPVSAIPVGGNWAVVEWRFIRIYGFLAAMIRRGADLVGYHDVLPIGTSLGAWRAAYVYENDYFTPTLKTKKVRK